MEGKIRCHTIPAGVVENERHVLLLEEVSILWSKMAVNGMKGLGLRSQRLYFAHALVSVFLNEVKDPVLLASAGVETGILIVRCALG